MDKWATKRFIAAKKIAGVSVAPGIVVSVKELVSAKKGAIKDRWERIRRELGHGAVIVKPRGDGCSSGIVRLASAEDLTSYLSLIQCRAPFIPAGTFANQRDIVEMPQKRVDDLLFEAFIETDLVRVKGNTLKVIRRSGLIEITCAVVEIPGVGARSSGHLKALNPSLTVAEGAVLSVEEKFQGGTGINITPPPDQIVSPKAVSRARGLICAVAKALGIRGYCRIDAFMDTTTGAITVIEVNTLPGLTPSTVFYHQGLAEKPQLFPLQLLELLVANKGY
jgi:D-alanine-D-alanine ligase-like ATP-grasp enzyme